MFIIFYFINMMLSWHAASRDMASNTNHYNWRHIMQLPQMFIKLHVWLIGRANSIVALPLTGIMLSALSAYPCQDILTKFYKKFNIHHSTHHLWQNNITRNTCWYLSNYTSTYPNATINYHASNMVLITALI